MLERDLRLSNQIFHDITDHDLFGSMINRLHQVFDFVDLSLNQEPSTKILVQIGLKTSLAKGTRF